jgi:RNA polymerase sigma-70 factor (ECF subfamily)
MPEAAERLYEQVLVLRCQAGDDAAFAELVQRYHERLRYYIRRLLGETSSAEDVLQDVWLRVYRKLPALRRPGALSVWLYRIARNAALAALRQRRGWIELAEEPAAPGPDDESEFSPEDAARIHTALQRLRRDHKEVLVLRFLEQMSYEEIAKVVGCPVGTVRSRIYYAKRALQREMRG